MYYIFWSGPCCPNHRIWVRWAFPSCVRHRVHFSGESPSLAWFLQKYHLHALGSYKVYPSWNFGEIVSFLPCNRPFSYTRTVWEGFDIFGSTAYRSCKTLCTLYSISVLQFHILHCWKKHTNELNQSNLDGAAGTRSVVLTSSVADPTVSTWIRIILGSWIRIRIRKISRIRIDISKARSVSASTSKFSFRGKNVQKKRNLRKSYYTFINQNEANFPSLHAYSGVRGGEEFCPPTPPPPHNNTYTQQLTTQLQAHSVNKITIVPVFLYGSYTWLFWGGQIKYSGHWKEW